jgi:hypothetical protein
MAFDIQPYLSAGRHVVSTAAGFAAGFGVHSIGSVSTENLVEGFDHIFSGLNEIAIGVGILAPAVMAIWAAISGSLAARVAGVKAASPDQLVQAVKQVAPNVLINAAAEAPGVTRIVATQAIAEATPSPKVVAAPSA